MKPRSTTKHAERLLPQQRQTLILDVLTEHGAVSLQRLAERLGASFSTIRRDLDELEERRLVERTHGGAILGSLSKKHVGSAEMQATSVAMKEAKQSIGRVAATRVREGDSVIFDSSTTVLEAARALLEAHLPFTAVTNNIKIAELLSTSDHVRLIVPGGTRRPGTNLISGEPGDSFLGQLHVEIAFIGGQNASSGVLTDSRIESASTKRLLMRAARTKILLIDAWKFGGPGLCEVAPLSEFHEVITDFQLPDQIRRELEAQRISVTIEAASSESPGEESTRAANLAS